MRKETIENSVFKQNCGYELPRQHIWQYALSSERIYNSSDLNN